MESFSHRINREIDEAEKATFNPEQQLNTKDDHPLFSQVSNLKKSIMKDKEKRDQSECFQF